MSSKTVEHSTRACAFPSRARAWADVRFQGQSRHRKSRPSCPLLTRRGSRALAFAVTRSLAAGMPRAGVWRLASDGEMARTSYL
jgi:hypothetical protein